MLECEWYILQTFSFVLNERGLSMLSWMLWLLCMNFDAAYQVRFELIWRLFFHPIKALHHRPRLQHLIYHYFCEQRQTLRSTWELSEVTIELKDFHVYELRIPSWRKKSAANIHLKTEVVTTFYLKVDCWDCPS